MHLSRKLLLPAFVLALCAPAFAYQDGTEPPAKADDSAYLVPDAEFVMKFNMKQLVTSALMKKIGTDGLKDGIKNNAALKSLLDSAGIDPLKDIDSILVSGAGTSAKDGKAHIVIRGKFDKEKLNNTLKKREEIRPIKEGDLQMFEFSAQDQKMVGAVIDANTVALTTSKEATVALAKGGKKSPLSKEMKTAVAKFSGKETMTMAVVINDELKKQIENAPRVGESAAKLKALTFAVSINESIAVNLNGMTDDEKAAKALATFLELGKAGGKAAIAGNDDIPPFVADLLDAIKIGTAKDGVGAELKIAKETIDKALKLIGIGG